MIPKKKQMLNLVLLSFKYDNAFNEGFLKYRDWYKKISIILDIDAHNVIRIIFNELLKKKIFEKRKVKRRVEYLFNPYKKEWKNPYDNYDGVVTFD